MMKTIRDVELKGKRVLVRCDFNVPLTESGTIVDDFRIQQTLSTIAFLREKGAKVVLLSHLGKPQKEADLEKRRELFSLRPVAERLGELLNTQVLLAEDCIGKDIEKRTLAMGKGDIALLENVRFHEGEEENEEEFARALAQLGDVYVNDAFGVNHRAHASVVGLPRLLPSAAGLLVEKETEALEKIRTNPARPLVAIVGGTKIETKADFLDEMSLLADVVLTGNPVFHEIQEKGLQFRGAEKIQGPVDGVPSKEEALDIGPETQKLYAAKIKKAKTVFWTGPLGKVEESPYDQGSVAAARAIVESAAFSVVGGGDLNGFLAQHGLRDKFSHASTGGGSMLAFLSGEKLPGLQALNYYGDNKESS